MYFSLFIVVQRSLNTFTEGFVANAGHAIRDGDGGQATATIEGMAVNGGQAVRDGDGGQSGATRESIIADGCHAVWCTIVRNR